MNHAKKQHLSPAQKQLNHFMVLRWVCRAIVLITVTVSIWANVLHAESNSVAIVLAALPPLIALGAWELVSRIPIRQDARWLIRWSRPLATIALFGGAAYLSYFHQRSAIMHYSNGDISAAVVLPGLIDGLMIVTSVSTFELNARILLLEATITGASLQLPRKNETVLPERPKRVTGKERVAAVLAKNPTLSAAELAKLAGVSESYAYTLSKELGALAGAEL